MQKNRVIVSRLPRGYQGADEGVQMGEDGKPVLDVNGDPIRIITPDVFRLEAGGVIWRARLGVSTPIPEVILEALKESDAVWRLDVPGGTTAIEKATQA